MNDQKTDCPFDTAFLEALTKDILQSMQSMTDQPIGIHIMICTHGMNMRVGNMNTTALKEALQFALQKADQEGLLH